MSQRVEHEFHDRIWGAANAYQRVEQAVRDARFIAYKLRDNSDPASSAHALAENWLDDYGRDVLREAKPNARN
jgi:hypothetical protein